MFCVTLNFKGHEKRKQMGRLTIFTIPQHKKDGLQHNSKVFQSCSFCFSGIRALIYKVVFDRFCKQKILSIQVVRIFAGLIKVCFLCKTMK